MKVLSTGVERFEVVQLIPSHCGLIEMMGEASRSMVSLPALL